MRGLLLRCLPFREEPDGLPIPHLFLYSMADKLVDWKRVEEFANLVEGHGAAVRKERYEKTSHVLHWKGEDEGGMGRYWGSIEETWHHLKPGSLQGVAKL